MSVFVGAAIPSQILAANYYDNCDSLYFGKSRRAPNSFLLSDEVSRSADNANDRYVYKTRWWPRSGQILGGWGDGTQGDTFQNKATSWKLPFTVRGANGRLAFVGYTRDQYGSRTGGCTVRLYRVSTEEQVSKVTSDADGLYFATTPYNDAHFMVIHNPAGNQAGATANTLLPA